MMGGRLRRGGVGGRTLTASAPELDAMMAPAVALSDGGMSTIARQRSRSTRRNDPPRYTR